MPNHKIVIAYEGTNYCGWQIQPNGVSIQELIQKNLSLILRQEIKITGSGRTDAGVHAMGQVAHFRSDEPATQKTLFSLNSLLPPDIRVLSLEHASDDFHAQYSATGKIYHYHLHLDKVRNPFNRAYSWHVPYANVERLEQATRYFLGTHDFTSFANEAHTGVAAHDPVRTIQRIDVVPQEGGVRLEFEADGFLYKMVRNITGTLVEASSGQIQLEQITSIINSKDRRKAGMAAPPQGLFLMKVHYGDHPTT